MTRGEEAGGSGPPARRTFGKDGRRERTGRKGAGGDRRGAKGPGGQGRPGPPGPGLFRDIVLAPDRDLQSGAAPVVSYRDDEDPAFAAELERRARFRVRLLRRGVEHGNLAELDPEGLVPPRPRRRRREALASERWCAGRPLVLPGTLTAVPRGLAAEAERLRRRLAAPPGLLEWLRERLEGDREVRVAGAAEELFDPERDLERVELVRTPDGAPELAGLWAKTGRLSLHADDASLRLRLSFGREADDDASADEPRHRAIAVAARRLLPGARELEGLDEVREALERRLGAPPLYTQHIAYWNAPGGGALFHHDAFLESDEDGQRGVLYLQLSGATAWLALSLEDLAQRVRELVALLDTDELPDLEEELFPDQATRDEVRERVADWRALHRELALPGCGLLGPLVNRGPEVTTFLADAGHAAVLHPGDAILLPNHGLARTAMHSVFSASEEPGYALSVALRVDRRPAGP